MPSAPTTERLAPWFARLAWVGVLVLGEPAIDGATADRAEAIRTVARFGGLALWVAGVAAMAIPAVVSLTASRVIVPVAVPAAVIAWVAGADPVDAALLLVCAVLAALVVGSAEFGRAFVQASAYGEEDRHPLRIPPAYGLAAVLTWVMWTTALLAGPLLLAAERWWVGGTVSLIAAAGAVWAWPRWHRLSRRWFVVVPVGLVIHDHLVLAETLMLRRQELLTLRLAPADTGAADLTGPAAGHAIEISTAEPITAIHAATPGEPRGKVIHFTGCLVSPSRPGRALKAAAGRRLPVG